MSDFDFSDIRRLDGGLLLVFRELLTHRRATEAALRLGLSQSAISHALGRLRELFNDPLFVRRSHGLEPTQRALELGPRIEALIELAGTTLSSRSRFDAAQARRRFSLAGPESIASILGARLAEIFIEAAPNATFAMRPLLIDLALNALRRGEIDLALGQFGRIPPGLEAEVIYSDRLCVIARHGHPTVQPPLDFATYAATPHVFVGLPPGANFNSLPYDPEQMAKAYGVVPGPEVVSTVAYVSQWENAMLMVAASDAIAECPERLALRYAGKLGLQIIDAPAETGAGRPHAVQAVRRAGGADPGVDWLLEQVRLAAR
jgi:DNA-binding transcriptional LysR family regulator